MEADLSGGNPAVPACGSTDTQNLELKETQQDTKGLILWKHFCLNAF